MCQPSSIFAAITPRPLGSTLPLNLTRSCFGGAKTELICARRMIAVSTLLLDALLELRQHDVDVGDVLRFREVCFERAELAQSALVIALLHVNVAGKEARFLIGFALGLYGGEFADRFQALVEVLFQNLSERQLVIGVVADVGRHAGLGRELLEARLAFCQRVTRAKSLRQFKPFR